MDFSKGIAAYHDEIIEKIRQAVRIDSVESEPLPGKPFGEGPAKALQFFLDLGNELGFSGENFENYAAHVDYGTGEEMLGILAHVDVVPVGDGWLYPPFSGDIVGGKIYGRGTQDDKGPIVVCMYAVKILKDLGVPLSKKIRFILGANEETNFGCMKHYFGKLKMPMPQIAFTPDSAFPVTYAEKGIFQWKLKKKCSEVLKIKGGNAYNSVAETASVALDIKYFEPLKKALSECSYPVEIEFNVENGCVVLHVKGKASHAARLESGINAIAYMFEVLAKLELTGELKEVVDFFQKNIGTNLYGEKLGMNLQDEASGRLTFNVGKVLYENGEIAFYIDNRIPITKKIADAEKFINKAIEGTDWCVEYKTTDEPLHVPKDSFLVETLMDVYKTITGDIEAQPRVASGGTYARTVNNCVAFGCILKEQADLKHQKNEHLEIDKIDTWLKIYLEAIYRLAI